jgi:hypothetical protein
MCLGHHRLLGITQRKGLHITPRIGLG